MENIINYLTFILGYDLLEDVLKKDTETECNIAYYFCKSLAEKFMVTTNIFLPKDLALYNLVDKWVNTNFNQIITEYEIYYNTQKNSELSPINEEGNIVKL